MTKSDHIIATQLLDSVNHRLKQWLIGLIRVYQIVLSSWLGPSCRFAPSCSEFALEALEIHGLCKGSWLALCRISRCHPFGASGYDPVPQHSSLHSSPGHGERHGQ